MTEMEQLGRRAVACPGWRWMLGMLAVGEGANTGEPRTYRITDDDTDATARFVICDPAPDLTDPATLGCLLALVREAQGEPRVSACLVGPTAARAWVCVGPLSPKAVYGLTEAEALVSALEAAECDARYATDRAKSGEIAEKLDDCDDVRRRCGKCGCEFCQCGVGSDEDILDDEEEALLNKLCDVVENELNAIFKCPHSRERIKKRLQRALSGGE